MTFEIIFFAGWPGVLRAVISGALAYFALVVLLRVSGKRTLAKMNAFDLVVTVALGSILATITLSKDVALAEGVAAIAVLVGLQFVVAWLSARFKSVSQLVKAEPALLFHRGEFLRAAIRSSGKGALENVEAVILETDGSFSVVSQSEQPASALANVRGCSAH